MLDIHRTDNIPDTKIYFSHSIQPSYIDPQNVSTKKKPFSTFNKQKFSHTLDVMLPEEIYALIKDELSRVESLARARYARVHMKLEEILESEFLNGYIKQGNIMMLSEGRPFVDNRFELYNGTLRMELNRPTYERCGLQGIPIEDGGKKHQKQRWIVEYDLRVTSMKHGGKAFSRLERACRDVLNHSLTWLFYNFNPSSAESLAEKREPISNHAPWIHETLPETRSMEDTRVPRLCVNDLTGLYAEEDALALLEYLHMLSLDSPRLHNGDNIDPHLSRYEVPDFGHGVVPKNMVCVRWRGFIPPAFIRDLFIIFRRLCFRGKGKVNDAEDVTMGEGSMIEEHVSEDRWFAMSAHAFGGRNSWTIMQFAGRETLVWETEG